MAAGDDGGGGVMRAFTWTARRDAVLRDCHREGLSVGDTAFVLGCDADAVRARARALQLDLTRAAGAARSARVATRATATVPRPVAPPRPGLIDISKAPSSMGTLADKWAGRS